MAVVRVSARAIFVRRGHSDTDCGGNPVCERIRANERREALKGDILFVRSRTNGSNAARARQDF